jgi:membrane-bound lytic murein transglycosylase B
MGARASSSFNGTTTASRTTASSSLSPPSAAQFARAISDASQRNNDAFMRKIFNRHASKEKLSASALVAALKDVNAPVLAAASSEGSCDAADYVFRRADANMSGDVDYPE